MNINSISTILNLPALDARKLMQSLAYKSVTEDQFSCIAATFSTDTQQLLHDCIEEGYLEKDNSRTVPAWNLTMQGAALAKASAAKKFKRATADRHFNDFLKRVEQVNNDDQFLMQVNKVALFGSYLQKGIDVSDIDLFIWLGKKTKFLDTFHELKTNRTNEMLENGRRFKDLGEELHWPELDTKKYLKKKSRVINFEALNVGYESLEHRIVFEITNSSLLTEN